MDLLEAMSTGKERLQAYFGDRLKIDQPLGKYTSARVGGSAELFLAVQSASELLTAVEIAFEHNIPYFVLGGGSNILIADGGISGLVIQNRAKGTRFRNTGFSVVCEAESGANLSSLTRQCISKGLGGLEWAIGVPGTVGGAVVGNSGAHGSDMNTNLLATTVWVPGQGIRIFSNEALEYGYRDSILKREQKEDGARRVVLSAEIQLTPEPTEVLSARADAFNSHRRQTQPAGATMGSMFKNPEHFYAGYLIESAGMKGYNLGGASISDLHANFFVNNGDATAEDIQRLLAEAFNRVHEQFGVMMEPEVELVGNWEFDLESEPSNDTKGASDTA